MKKDFSKIIILGTGETSLYAQSFAAALSERGFSVTVTNKAEAVHSLRLEHPAVTNIPIIPLPTWPETKTYKDFDKPKSKYHK